MSTLQISLSDDLMEKIKAQAARDGFSSAADYVEQVVRDRLREQAKAELEAMLIAGVESGPPIKVDDEYWRERNKRWFAIAERSS